MEANQQRQCIYFMQNNINGHIRIGFSVNLLARKVTSGGNGKFLIIKVVYGATKEVERQIHQKFADIKVKGRREWFYNLKTLQDFIASLPDDTYPSVLEKITKEFKITSIKEAGSLTFHYKTTLESIIHTLDKALVNSKNSGFYQGIKFAQEIIGQRLQEIEK